MDYEIRSILDVANSLRGQIKSKSLKGAMRSKAEAKQSDDDPRFTEFARIIRDGVADEVRNVMLEVRREMDHHRKMGRLSKSSLELVAEMDVCFEEFQQKKELLAKYESALDLMKPNMKDAESDRLLKTRHQDALDKARNLREELIQRGDRLLKFYERIDKQIHQDREMERNLHAALEKCLTHLSGVERGKIEALVRQKSTNVTVEAHIKLLSKLIEQLANTIPAVRQEEIQRLYQQARLEFQRKNYNETLQTLNDLFKFDRKHILAHRLRSRVFQVLNNKVAHLCELRNIAAFDNAEAADYAALGDVLAADGKIDEAYILYEKASSKKPDRKHLERFADMACQFRHWYRAVDAYRKILEKNPGDAALSHKLGCALFEDNQEQEAFDLLRYAVRRDDSRAQSRVCLGEILRRRGIVEEALKCFAQAAKLDNSQVDAYYWWGMQLYDRGEYGEALKKAQKAVELDSNRARNRMLLARCLEAVGAVDRAVEALEPIVSLDIPPVDALLAFSEICRKGGRLNRARDVIERFHQRYSRLPLIRSEYGLVLLECGEFSKAAPFLDPAGGFRAAAS
ncbi:MAG: tetratricopeptide repeat protein [Candidatus Omnitrophota bacterium]